MTKSNNDWLDEILDKNLEDIVDANFNGYNYALNKTAKAAITAKINEMLISELEKLGNDFMPKDTNCAEFYQDNDDSCEPIEHARRSGRWEVDMELHDFITDRIAELRKRKDEVLR